MSGTTALAVGLFVLALVWAYSRHTFDAWLGLANPHGGVSMGPDMPLLHTGNGYGKVQASTVIETGPVTGPSGPVGGTSITRVRDVPPADLTLPSLSSVVTGRMGRAASGLIQPNETVIRVTGDPSQSFASPELGMSGYATTSGRWIN